MTEKDIQPRNDEFELTLFGPGYGESLVLHIGDGNWVIVDSHLTPDDVPRATYYLESIGVNPAEAVCLIVATHWHDDHIRGIADLLEKCCKATFCCANALVEHEFLAAVDALEKRHLTVTGSGAREIYRVFKHLVATNTKPCFATADRRILSQGSCEIWSLSPDDKRIFHFLKSIGSLFPSEGQGKSRVPYQSPNQVSVVLWVEIGDIAVLLGSDLEQCGWTDILQSNSRPNGNASVFKIPHHGSQNADEPEVWNKMLKPNPIAVLTPWTRGRSYLPKQRDIRRILSCSGEAYATSLTNRITRKPMPRPRAVEKTIQESGVKLKQFSISDGWIRLRRPFDSSIDWTAELFGSARSLKN